MYFIIMNLYHSHIYSYIIAALEALTLVDKNIRIIKYYSKIRNQEVLF